MGRILRREVVLSFRFTLGPGAATIEEADTLAQLTALSLRMNGTRLPAEITEPARLTPWSPWYCATCPSVGRTATGYTKHAQRYPQHALMAGTSPRALG